MRISLQFIILIAVTISMGGEAMLAASADHDHHVDSVLDIESHGPADTDHGSHALHGCGVCHHVVGSRSLLLVVDMTATEHHLDLSSERVSSRALEPPFQPPIEVSV